MLLNALFKLAFAVAPDINSLTLQHKITRRLILQQARHHTINSALTDCKLTVSGSVSLSFSLFFSPFRHRTRSLSVTDKYLALPDGPGGFRQGFTCPAVLGCFEKDTLFSFKGLSPSMAKLSSLIQLTKYFVTFRIICKLSNKVPQPPSHNDCSLSRAKGLGCLPFRSPLLWESLVYFLFVPLLRCFSSRAFLLADY